MESPRNYISYSGILSEGRTSRTPCTDRSRCGDGYRLVKGRNRCLYGLVPIFVGREVWVDGDVDLRVG